MKGLILSGGEGTRLRPLTHTSAKQLIPVANKPTLFYGLEALVEAGIRDIGIVVGETYKEIKAAVGDGEKWGIKVAYIQQEAPLGLAHAVKIAENFIGQDSFVMYLGDNILKNGIVEFVKSFSTKKPNAYILLTKVKNPEQFGVVNLDENGRILKLEEKPKQPKSDLALVGIYLFDKNIFKAVNAIKPSGRNELEITDAIQWLIEYGFIVDYHLVEGWWKDTGKPADILEANQLILETIETSLKGQVDEESSLSGRVNIGEASQIIKSKIRGPVVIGKNVLIKNSYIGPFTAISDNVVVENSEIEHSIIMENSKISHISGRIDQSLIGRGVEVSASLTKPSTHQFILGDKSQIIIS